MVKDRLIAVIDDDTLDQFIFRKVISLTNPSLRVIEFSSGIEALTYFELFAGYPAKLPDVLLLDIRMPLMNGWEYLERFSKLQPRLSKRINHYICTSSIDPVDRDLEGRNVRGYFSKPITPEHISKILDDVNDFDVNSQYV